jgi:CBS-domain-containing membrane protein
VLKCRLLPDRAERVAEIMSTNVPSVAPDTPLVDVAARLRMHVHARIPVVECGRLVGVVTRRALLQRLAVVESTNQADTVASMRVGKPSCELAPPNFIRAVRASAVPVLSDRL